MTVRVNVAPGGGLAEGFGRGFMFGIAVDRPGSAVVYPDTATNLIPGETLFPDTHIYLTKAADIDGDGLPTWWEAQWGLAPGRASSPDGPADDPDGDGETNLAEYLADSHPTASTHRYLAEGATGDTFSTRIALLNPGAATARVRLDFSAVRSTPPYLLRVPPGRRRTIDVRSLNGMAAAEFSTTLESDQPVVADRTMTWEWGGHAETAVVEPASRWYFAEGATHSGFDLFYLLQNPHPEDVPVTIRYLRPSGGPLVKQYVLPATSRTTLWINLEDSGTLVRPWRPLTCPPCSK